MFPGGTGGKESARQCRRQETQVLSLDQEALLEEEMATNSSILTGKIPWAEEPGGPRGHKESDTMEQLKTHTEMFPEETAEHQHPCIWILQPHGHEALFSEPPPPGLN